MSAGTAIGMVSESLAELLTQEMAVRPQVPATILSPDEAAPERRINLFLFRVAENPFLRNLDWQVRPGAPDRLVPPPLSLNLHYLLTAYAPNDARSGNAAAQEILGDAMRVLYEHPVVPERHLVPGLKDAPEQIRVVHVPLDFEDVSRIWGTFDEPYRTSACYEVSVVQLDAKQPGPEVAPRVRTVVVGDPQAPFRPPLVSDMAPTRATAGSQVRFAGEHLADHRPDVRIDGLAAAVSDVEDHAFVVRVPPGLAPGLHEAHVDVAGLFHRVFALEVIP